MCEDARTYKPYIAIVAVDVKKKKRKTE